MPSENGFCIFLFSSILLGSSFSSAQVLKAEDGWLPYNMRSEAMRDTCRGECLDGVSASTLFTIEENWTYLPRTGCPVVDDTILRLLEERAIQTVYMPNKFVNWVFDVLNFVPKTSIALIKSAVCPITYAQKCFGWWCKGPLKYYEDVRFTDEGKQFWNGREFFRSVEFGPEGKEFYVRETTIVDNYHVERYDCILVRVNDEKVLDRVVNACLNAMAGNFAHPKNLK